MTLNDLRSENTLESSKKHKWSVNIGPLDIF
jgi:hypothetical protein